MCTELNQHEALLFEVAEGGTYDSEYDGRVYTYCKFCDIDLERDSCDEDCLSVRARVLLKDKIQSISEYKRKLEDDKERDKRVLEIQNSGRVNCIHCHQRKHKDSLERHQRESVLCAHIQAIRYNQHRT